MKSLIIIIFIIGIVFVFVGYSEKKYHCPSPKIEYRYIPRSFYEEQVTGSDLKNIYSNIFDKPSIWSSYPFNTTLAESGNKNFDNFIEEDSAS